MAALKSQLSKKNEDYISKNRYYELKYHCLQYPEWVRASDDLLNKGTACLEERYGKTNDISDPVAFIAMKREYYQKKIDLIKSICKEADPRIDIFLLAVVANGYTYDSLAAKYGVLPVGRNSFFKAYRRFFKLLDSRI